MPRAVWPAAAPPLTLWAPAPAASRTQVAATLNSISLIPLQRDRTYHPRPLIPALPCAVGMTLDWGSESDGNPQPALGIASYANARCPRRRWRLPGPCVGVPGSWLIGGRRRRRLSPFPIPSSLFFINHFQFYLTC